MATRQKAKTAYQVTVSLTDSLHRWFVRHAEADGKTLQESVQMAVECYADSIRIDRRRDDEAYDRMGVPQKDRVY